ncbi:ATP-binding protein [Desulfobacter latus]|uniref:Putative DNA binding domain-containing protein n=1 Tax=Desulfobacter latus TaxID=2292 RepID=A0A850T5D7_9BACT|nr:putative DNA binding domain-containing protein [Desulfobacter latus]
MSVTITQFEKWLDIPSEDEHLEFKEAKNRFDFEKLVGYCVALANEGGGHMVFGVTDKPPRQVVGTAAFENLERTKAGLLERLRLRIFVEEILHSQGRVLVFEIPSRPIGMPVQYKGTYWMRGGEDLVPMTPDMLKRIFDESGPDFSAEICPKATLADLAPEAIERFRAVWARRSGNESLRELPAEQLLEDAEFVVDRSITIAALILLGTTRALSRHLAQAEIIYEYRSNEASIPYQQRKEFREGFFLIHDKLWETINLRNDLFHYQDGLFRQEIPTFNEAVVREAILNAISHRDYRLGGSVFIRQYPTRLEIVSPGGFPAGITVDNILWRQFPRNRRIAEIFAKCGLVERSGQGANRMFEECIKESKPMPDFNDTDDYQVSLTLHGEVQDPLFLHFLEKVGKEVLASFTTRDFLLLDFIHREESLPPDYSDRIHRLLDLGVIVRAGKGKYILSKRFYAMAGKKGVYTRKKGLDRDTNKALLLKHIMGNKKTGTRLDELLQVLPALSYNQVQTLMRELKNEGAAHVVGKTRGALWYPGGE